MSLVKGGTGVAIGASVGVVAGQACHLLLFISVLTGMILCGAAMAVAQAPEQGLKYRLLREFFGMPER